MNTLEHDWAVSPEEARAIQDNLRRRVILQDDFGELHSVAGVDVGFEQHGAITRAAIAVLSFPELEPVEHAIQRRPTSFPYVPGLLSFREIPAVLDAWKELKNIPDILLCDGQGIAHPRRLGIASHLGVLLDKPAIGVAKSRLVGKHTDVPYSKGTSVPLVDGEETIGMVVRTRDRVKPLYISPGHKVTLNTAVEIVLQCLTRYRLPETTRRADRLASQK